jgi:zinc D-Ala-D-Ala carboxypeptidase
MKTNFTIFLCLIALWAFAQSIDKNFLLGKTDPATDTRFVKLRDEHTLGTAKGGYLLKETYEAFIKMAEAASQQGVVLKIVAAARTFDVQKTIWENKWNGKAQAEGINMTTVADPVKRATIILRSSSMPGTSRYHWGSDIAINNLEESYFRKSEGKAVYNWLSREAARFGFCQPYASKNNGRTGYEEARWQWSYLHKAEGFLKEYAAQVRNEDITGFAGSETSVQLNVIEKYVRGVECSDLLVAFTIDGKMGFKGLRSVIINPSDYDDVQYYSEGLVAVKNKKGWGYADSKGQIKIPFQWPAVSAFANGRAVVNAGGDMPDWREAYQYIDANGKWQGKFFVPLKGKTDCEQVRVIGSNLQGEQSASYELSNCPNGAMSYTYQGWEWGNRQAYYPKTTIKSVIEKMANTPGEEFGSVFKKFKGEPMKFKQGEDNVEISVTKNKDGSYQSVIISVGNEYHNSSLNFSLDNGGVLLRSDSGS